MTDRKLIIFDFDGTLVDAHSQYEFALKEFSEARGLPWDIDKMGLGYTNPETADLGWGIALEEQPFLLKELNEFYSNEIVANQKFLPIVFPDADDVLRRLAHDYDFAIITARIRKSLVAVLDHYGWRDYFPNFRSLCCAEDRGYPIKPAPDAVYCLLRDTRHQMADCVMVGDTNADIQMANNAGMKSIAALWGVHPREKLAAENPTMMVETIKELPQAVEEIFNF